MATIRDVAKHAGVSVTTVSAAINGNGRVSAETRARIIASAEAVGYRPNAAARNLRSGRSGLIGVVVTDITNPFWGNLARSIEEAAAEAGYSVVIGNTGGNGVRERTVLDKLRGHNVDGILLASTGEHNHEYLRGFFASGGPPLVTIDQYFEDLPFDFVGIDNQAAIGVLVELLVRLGHRRIAFVGGEEGHWTAKERLAGYLAAMQVSGIEPDPALYGFAGYQAARAYRNTVEMLTKPPGPTAIIGATNIVTMTSLQAIQDLGLNCPGDVSLAGIDELPWSVLVRPRIASMLQPIDRIGRLAMQWLLDRVQARLPDPRPRKFMFQCELAPGTSCRDIRQAAGVGLGPEVGAKTT